MASMLVNSALSKTPKLRGDSILPAYAQNVSQAAHMKLFQLMQVSSIQSQCLTSIQQAREDCGLVYLQLCGLVIVMLFQNSHLQSAKSLTCLVNSGIDLLVQGSITGDVVAKIEIF